jgi:hypothetical protein
MKTLTADEILEKTFQHLRVMLDETRKENRYRNKNPLNNPNRHKCPNHQDKQEECVVEQQK